MWVHPINKRRANLGKFHHLSHYLKDAAVLNRLTLADVGRQRAHLASASRHVPFKQTVFETHIQAVWIVTWNVEAFMYRWGHCYFGWRGRGMKKKSDILKKNKSEGEFVTLCKSLEDQEQFYKYFRVSRNKFNMVLQN